jgi:serine/threonine protein kinase
MDFKTRYKYNPKTDMLGKGGFAIVYKAKDTLLNRTVALKFFTHNDSNKNSLIQEISRAISLEHPNLCRYYDANMLESVNLHGELEKTEVGVMEYIDSGDLKSFLRLNISYLNKLLIDVLEGLSYLHGVGIIHRDLKPQNILIKSTILGPIAKITDFGISKHINSGNTDASQLMGTVEYMAPEQFSPAKYGINGRISTNLDLWSFGLMVYELIMNETLFGGKGGHSSAEQVMNNILHEDIVEERSKKIPDPYRRIIQLCVVKDANLRVQTATELIRVLKVHQERSEEIYNTIKALRDRGSDSGPGGEETRQIDFDETKTKVIHLAGNETMVIEVPQFAPKDADNITVTPGIFNDQTAETDFPDVPETESTETLTEIPGIAPETKARQVHKPKSPLKTETALPPTIKPVNEAKPEKQQKKINNTYYHLLQKNKLLIPLIILVILVTASVWVFLSKKSQKIASGKNNTGKIVTDYDYAIEHFGDTTTNFLARLREAASSGNDSARFKLANYYFSKKRYKDAVDAIQPLVLKNNPVALKISGSSQYCIGEALYMKKDFNKSFTIFNKLAKTNNAQAECMLGEMYYYGQGNIQQDKKQALNWYLKAANQKNDIATYLLGLLYADGDGVKKNNDIARKCFNWVIIHGVSKATRDAASKKLASLD